MGDKITTLIVEDDPMVMQVNEQYLSQLQNFTLIATAGTGREAVKQVKKFQPQLVILDIYLPDLDGIQTLKEIRKLSLPTDVIIVTAAKDVDTIQNAFRFGAIDYIVKPFRFERLEEALDAYLSVSLKLQHQQVLTQEDIDGMKKSRMMERQADAPEAIPKGLNQLTLKQVLICMKKGKVGMSAEEVAEAVGLARVTARRYLEYLEKAGRVLLEIQYGSVGRPVNKYTLKK